MNRLFQHNLNILETLVGGKSALELPQLDIQNLEKAYEFCKVYGFDLNIPEEQRKLWTYHRRAVTFIQEELLREGESFPEHLSDPNQLKDIAYLLIYASTRDNRRNSLQVWSCAILRVIHVLVHLRNDLFSEFSTEIQDQIIRPIQAKVSTDPVRGVRLASESGVDEIRLKKFEVKAFKTSNSSILKLLAKPEAVAFTILDKIGIRFVTRHLLDVFRVMKFLTAQNIISFPHVISDQSNNTIFPLDLFMETMESFTEESKHSLEDVDKILMDKLAQAEGNAGFLKKANAFTDDNYRFLKFICRKMVKIPMGNERQDLEFFYPFEIQILDYETFLKNLQGPSSHESYKERQRAQARRRILPFEVGSGMEGTFAG